MGEMLARCRRDIGEDYVEGAVKRAMQTPNPNTHSPNPNPNPSPNPNPYPKQAMQIHLSMPAGDILIFMTGQVTW